MKMKLKRETVAKSLALAVALSLSLSFVGCVGQTIRTSIHGAVTSEFISNPPGARIEVDGNYIGNAPLTYTWPWSYRDGSRFNNEVTIKAYPSGPGQFQQRKFFESHSRELPVIPAKIYFEMTSPDISKPESE